MKKPPSPDLGWERELLRECEAMAKYAFGSGMQVPGTLAQTLDDLADAVRQEEAEYLAAVSAPASPEGCSEVPDSTPARPRRRITKELAMIHGRLCKIVAPAKPKTILLLAEESTKHDFWRFLGPVPVVRGLVLVAILSLIALLATSLSPEVDGKLDWSNDSGMGLLLEELFIAFAAAIGASFYALFQVNRYIAAGTFDPTYNATYWIRLVLGLISGVILALLVPIDEKNALGTLAKPSLAMLGGFSVTVVHGILQRLVYTLESLIWGENTNAAAAQEQAANARTSEQLTQTRMQLASRLTRLQQQLHGSATPDVLKAELDRILGTLILPDPDTVGQAEPVSPTSAEPNGTPAASGETKT